jgi:hypothetical protein
VATAALVAVISAVGADAHAAKSRPQPIIKEIVSKLFFISNSYQKLRGHILDCHHWQSNIPAIPSGAN